MVVGDSGPAASKEVHPEGVFREDIGEDITATVVGLLKIESVRSEWIDHNDWDVPAIGPLPHGRATPRLRGARRSRAASSVRAPRVASVIVPGSGTGAIATKPCATALMSSK